MPTVVLTRKRAVVRPARSGFSCSSSFKNAAGSPRFSKKWSTERRTGFGNTNA